MRTRRRTIFDCRQDLITRIAEDMGWDLYMVNPKIVKVSYDANPRPCQRHICVVNNNPVYQELPARTYEIPKVIAEDNGYWEVIETITYVVYVCPYCYKIEILSE